MRRLYRIDDRDETVTYEEIHDESYPDDWTWEDTTTRRPLVGWPDREITALRSALDDHIIGWLGQVVAGKPRTSAARCIPSSRDCQGAGGGATGV